MIMKLKMLNGAPVDLTISRETSKNIEEIVEKIGPEAFGRILESYAAFLLDQTIRTVVGITGDMTRAQDVVNRGVMTRAVEGDLDQLVVDIADTLDQGLDQKEEYRRVKAAITTNVAKVVLKTIHAESLHVAMGIRIGA